MENLSPPTQDDEQEDQKFKAFVDSGKGEVGKGMCWDNPEDLEERSEGVYDQNVLGTSMKFSKE